MYTPTGDDFYIEPSPDEESSTEPEEEENTFELATIKINHDLKFNFFVHEQDYDFTMDEIEINPADLVTELLKQAEKYCRWALLREEMKSQRLASEHDRDVLYAQIEEAIRNDPNSVLHLGIKVGKVTDSSIKSYITACQSYRDEVQICNHWKKMEGVAGALAETHRMRAEMLKLLNGRGPELEMLAYKVEQKMNKKK